MSNHTMSSHLVVLLLALCAISTLADGIQLSIDCGSSDSYKDENSLSWIGDDDYIKTGESVVVDATISPRAMATLRLFTSRKKNCYSIKTTVGEKVLVRASFYYGNYDGKIIPPVFSLLLDGNDWIEVDTSIDPIISHEAIYVTRSDTINVCVAQTRPYHIPFISALEVRSLSMDMYKSVDPNFALIKRRRVIFGANESIRYPVDIYDRLWLSVTNSATFLSVKNTAPLINVSTIDDKPPQAVLRNAYISPKTSMPIKFITNLPESEVSVYMNLYFSEVSKLNSTQLRSFTMNVDGIYTSKPIIPPYGGTLEFTLPEVLASASTLFYLNATATSTLPVLVNAIEVYTISDALTNGTSTNDTTGLNVLKDEFKSLNDWNGDPCLPAPYVWDWLNCSDDATPRVTELHLGSFNLSGELPDFSSLDALETIDLSNNGLKGAIPEFFGTLPNLKLLNLSNNNFDGPVPTTLSNNPRLKVDLSGNPNIPTNGTEPNKLKPSSSAERNINLLFFLAVFTFPVFFLLY